MKEPGSHKMKNRMAIAALAILIASLLGSRWAQADFDVERDAFSIAGGKAQGGEGTYSVYQIAGQPVAGVGTGAGRLHHSGFLPVIAHASAMALLNTLFCA